MFLRIVFVNIKNTKGLVGSCFLKLFMFSKFSVFYVVCVFQNKKTKNQTFFLVLLGFDNRKQFSQIRTKQTLFWCSLNLVFLRSLCFSEQKKKTGNKHVFSENCSWFSEF